MNAKIDKDGVLTIGVDSELESYALRQWCNNNRFTRDNLINNLLLDFNTLEEKLPTDNVPVVPIPEGATA